MSSATTIFALLGAALVGLGIFGITVHAKPVRRVLALKLLGAGVFVLFGVIAKRGAGAGFAADPVPQAIIITGIIVALASSGLAKWLMVRLATEQAAASQPPDPSA
jgi:multicomponent Na+:H+ antiporter subunit C